MTQRRHGATRHRLRILLRLHQGQVNAAKSEDRLEVEQQNAAEQGHGSRGLGACGSHVTISAS